MLEQNLLRSQFRELLEQNLDAVGRYESAIEHSREIPGSRQLDTLLEDKKRHVELTERLLEIIE